MRITPEKVKGHSLGHHKNIPAIHIYPTQFQWFKKKKKTQLFERDDDDDDDTVATAKSFDEASHFF